MTRDISPITEEYSPQLCDSATGASLVAERVVEITDECKTGERTLLLFTRAKRGRIVQITHPYDGETYMGSHIHFFVDELGLYDDADAAFERVAERCGIPGFAFEDMVKRFAPPPPSAWPSPPTCDDIA